jgi:GntR family transcriptional regulator
MQNSKANRTIEAVSATSDDVKWLNIKKGEPILRIQRLVTTEDDIPLELLWANYRGDRFKYQIKM